MNDIRARFEEIWPVPDDVVWCSYSCSYWYKSDGDLLGDPCIDLDIRLDTFTRCQETTDVYVSLVDELVKEVEDAYSAYGVMPECVERAKQIMGRE